MLNHPNSRVRNTNTLAEVDACQPNKHRLRLLWKGNRRSGSILNNLTIYDNIYDAAATIEDILNQIQAAGAIHVLENDFD